MEEYEVVIKEWLEKEYDEVTVVHDPIYCMLGKLNDLEETHILTFGLYEPEDGSPKSIRVLGATRDHGWEVGMIHL